MKLETINRSELYQALAQNTAVVTGNSRLAKALQQEFQKQAIDSGQQVWETPVILPWNNWLRQTWEQVVFDGFIVSPELLLTDEQEQFVWESVIDASADTILRKEATAKKASEAWRQLINWRLNHWLDEFAASDDSLAFQLWADEFEKRCANQNWLPSARLPEQLLDCFSENDFPFDGKILLIGFDELTPLQQKLIASIQKAGGSVRWVEPAQYGPGQNSVVRLACADNNDEINTLTLWLSKQLQHQPASRIGVVVPDLGAHRSNLVHHLTERLVPGKLMAGCDEALPWNISLGLPLIHYPVIEAAFKVLELASGNFLLENTAPLLNSPYLAGAAEEVGARALLDRKLREIGEQKVSLKKIRWLAEMTGRPWHAPVLAYNAGQLKALVEKIPGSASSAEWVKWFSEILTCAGWAKDREYSAWEYQAIEAFHKLLARFSGLQAVSDRLSYSRALSLLKRLAFAQIFQPRTDSTPIQILGLYEAIGQQFDALWVMDLHDGNWPAAPQPNPFIPVSLQRQFAMPHADQARELDIALRITRRLQAAAPEVVMSYPSRKGEEPLRVSPLIRDLPEGDKKSIVQTESFAWSENIQHSGRHEVVDKDPAPPLQQQSASGGSGIFKYQSLCPFRAFAQYRLFATPLAKPQVGLDAMKRGQLFHTILELLWRDIRDLKTLLTFDDARLAEKIDAVIAQAIDDMAEHNPDTFTSRFRQIESSRLKQLTQQWLHIEKQRADFTVVEFEKEVSTDINGINVRLKIDRIDELADGRKVIIDYKTGAVSPSQWFGQRPEEPQLPLYSMVEGEGVSAVLYGQLKAADMKFSGVVEKAGLIPALPPSQNSLLKEATELWPQVLDDWKQTISQLAEDFRDGRAEVNPKKPNTCESSYCELAGLCRIDELMAGGSDG